ncbi:MAG: ComEC/Rec2 family competence protein [Patescibacteria group bacterium]
MALLASVIFSLSFLLLLKRSEAYILSALCLLGLLIGLARVGSAPVVAPGAFLPLFDTKVILTGNIEGDPDIRETTQRVTLAVEHEGEHMRMLVVAPLYPELSHGQVLEVRGTLERPEPFTTDGGRTFRYDSFLAKDGVFGIIGFAKIRVLDDKPGLRTYLYEAKHLFVRGLSNALPEPYASLAAGIIAGGKQGLGKELLEAFTIAGLLPIVVLSGYNVMIIAEAILRGFSFLRKRTAIILAGITIFLFVLAAGAGASATRAGIMAGLGLFARASGRTYDALRALVFVLVIMLLWNPLLLVHDPGFQFSFVATLGLILGSPVIEPHLMRIRNAFLRDIVATTVAAQLFVLPLLLYQTGNLSLVALPANVLVLPAVPLAMLFSAIAGFVGMLAPALATVVGLPALLLLWYLVEVAQTSAALPFASLTIPMFPFWVTILLYMLLAFGMHWLKEKVPATDVAGTPSP